MNPNSIVLFFRNRILFWTAAGLWTLACSCSELPDPLFTKSVIQGNIHCYYISGSPDDNISVTARGPYGDRTALTNSEGYFQIGGLGNGTYKLVISKEGFGTKYHYGIQLFGDDTASLHDEIYERISGFKLPALKEIYTRHSNDWLNASTIAIVTNIDATGYTPDMPVRVFMADFENVSYKNYQCTRRAFALARGGYENLMLLVEDLPFESRKEIFLIAYVCNPFEEGYFDYYTGVWTFSTMEPEERSEVLSFTMPSP
jgi:hypothetical protein